MICGWNGYVCGDLRGRGCGVGVEDGGWGLECWKGMRRRLGDVMERDDVEKEGVWVFGRRGGWEGRVGWDVMEI